MNVDRSPWAWPDPAEWSLAMRLLAAAAVLVPLWAGVAWSS